MDYSKVPMRSSSMGEEDEHLEPSTPTGQYYSSSSLSMSILAVLEIDIPIDDSQTMSLLKNVFLPINSRFSSLLVTGENGEKHWKKVTVNLGDHVKVPLFEEGLPVECYDEYLQEYLSKIVMERLPKSRPLWEIYIFKYPTSNAAGTVVFKLHHALGDGYSLMGALFSCFQRSDNPSLPLTFPKIRSDDYMNKKKSVFETLAVFKNTITDFTWSLWKGNMSEDHASPIRSAKEGVEFRPVSISTVTFSLDQIKEIKAKLGGTLNDVIVGIIFYGIRLYMETASKGAGNARSTALVLLNTREIITYQSVEEMGKSETKGPWGNNFGFIHVFIPNATNLDTSDPLKFVFEAKKMITKKKNSLVVYLTGKLIDLMRKLRGPEETSKYIRDVIWKSSMAISNLIGPVEKISLANHPVKGIYFMVVNVPQVRSKFVGLDFVIRFSLMVTMVSYMGKMRIAVGAEKELIDQALFNACLDEAFEGIFKAALSSS
ncbi:hypothetical protein MKW98_010797 [Papaver atlanticum]|uniref:Diacylglycerol O-acyltransferase n=1 Tax=Papaver atlanticum TaxID=357466 RepID=A0AAD4SM41_9MAGN|nr:hypothetical protein MKW98_010797 [Papaver atlanticum]